MSITRPLTIGDFKAALASLPPSPENIPAFFFAHGSPVLASSPQSLFGARAGLMSYQGPQGPLAAFLKDFGPTLLSKYRLKGIVVFSAHWETKGERLVTDYGEENPLLMDYYGFAPEYYKLKFQSRGDSGLAERVVKSFEVAGIPSRLTTIGEARGRDGRGFLGPGLDHGVFVPFRLMFGEEFPSCNALKGLRKEGILILSGGLTIHNLRDMDSFSPNTANPVYKKFDQALHEAISTPKAAARKDALFALTRHPAFRAAHPREEHFIPLFIAAGAGDDNKDDILHQAAASETANEAIVGTQSTNVITLNGMFGIPTFAFGN